MTIVTALPGALEARQRGDLCSGSMPAVSAILPSYNHARYLRRAIESVLAQDADLELVLIDDASTDESPRIIDEFAGDPRVRITHHERNRGVSPTFNEGLELARADVVAYIGSDDYWLPEHLSGGLEDLERSGAAMVYGRARLVDENDHEVTDLPLFDSVPNESFFEALLDRPNFVPFISVLMRRDIVQGVGGFDETVVTLQDYDLWLRLSVGHPVYFRDAETVAFRWDGGNTSAPTAANKERYTREFTHIMEKLMREFAGELERRDLADGLRRRLARHYVRMARRSSNPAEQAELYRTSLSLNPKLRVAQRYLFSRVRALVTP